MKKFYKEALKPNKPFEQWAKEHNIDLPAKENPKQKTFYMTPMFRWSSLVVSLVLMVAIILPFALYNPNVPPPTNNKIYSQQDVTPQELSLDELYSLNSLILFNKNQIVEYGFINIERPLDNLNLKLSYNIKGCLIATSDGENAFYVDMLIRLYKNFDFYTKSFFLDLQESLSINDVEIFYKIQHQGLSSKAYVFFSVDELEYFLSVTGFEDVTTLSLETIQILLEDLLM